MASETLQDFLTTVGFKIDETAGKRVMDALKGIQTQAILSADAIETVAKGIIRFAENISSGLENLYYSAQRIRSSAGEIKAFAYAVSQLGGTTEGATSSLENFARKLRENPNYGNWLKQFGVDAQNPVKAFEQLGKYFQQLNHEGRYFQALQIGQELGIDEPTLRALISGVGKFTDDYKAKLKAAGLDPQVAAENGRKLAQVWRSFTGSIDVLIDKVGGGIADGLSKPVQDFVDFLDKNSGRLSDAFIQISKALLDLVERFSAWVASDDGKKAIDALADPKTWQNFATEVKHVADAFERLLKMVDKLFDGPLGKLVLGQLGLGLTDSWNPFGGGGDSGGDGGSGSDSAAPGDGKKGFIGRAWDGVKGLFGGGGGGGEQRGRVAKGGWWTPENQKHAFDRLVAGGMNPTGAIALISRWKNVESTQGGPNASNNIGGGHWGIAQMDRARWARVGGSKGIDDQLDAVLDEYRTGRGDGAGPKASHVLANAKTDAEGATGASAYERAEHYDPRTGRDAYTDVTERGMAEVRRNVMGAVKAATPAPPKPATSPFSVHGFQFNPDAASSAAAPPPTMTPPAVSNNSATHNHLTIAPNITSHNSEPQKTSELTYDAVVAGTKMALAGSNLGSALG